jgi:ComF family protein
VDYDFPWASCVVDFKFHQAPAWAPVFAALMQLNPLLEAQLESVAHVLPMPLSKASLRERGYNQALELARALSPERTRPHWLMKLRETAPQSELKGAARLRNLHGALALEPLVQRQIEGARVLLVDDVMTTGTTLREAAQRLRQCGASEVHAAVFARTLAPGSGWES